MNLSKTSALSSGHFVNELTSLMRSAVVIPVIQIERPDDAVPLARALVAGGIRVLEVTLRTEHGLAAIAAMAAEVPEAIVGVGTVTRGEQLAAARDAGARFAVSPGLTDALAQSAQNSSLPFLPGVMTPSDIMRARDAGFTRVKLFPAGAAGGVAMLKSLQGPFSDMLFCPTGGIDAGNLADFLALPNVACVGGSWLTPAPLIRRQDWREITRLAKQAATAKQDT